MHTHTRSIKDKVFEIWRSPGRFTKNPDIVRLPDGRLLLVYSDNDAHWSLEEQVLTVLASDDEGKHWTKLAEVDRADLRQGDERFVTPRLSLLSDGRLVIVIDHDDYGHFHEDQPPGNWLYWSSDGGDTWSGSHKSTITGFEPDRMMELPDGRLAVCSHLVRREAQEYAEIISCSNDGGANWYEQATIAHDGYHRFCEGALVILDHGTRFACVMRESHSGGFPSFVSFSEDNAKTWTEPKMMPFAIHRPYAKQLPDGRVLVTGRNVNGGLGTYAWAGDLQAEAGTYAIGGPRTSYRAELSEEALIIRNTPGHECSYCLLPPESSKSEVLFEAEIMIDGRQQETVAFLSVSKLVAKSGPIILSVAKDRITLTRDRPDLDRLEDFSRYRTLSIHHTGGLLQVKVDGKTLIQSAVFREENHVIDHHGGSPDRRTMFGQFGESGVSYWKRVRYEVKNPTQPPFSFAWSATSGQWPDQYQRDRLIQIHENYPDQKPGPDHGYSSWVFLNDSRIFLVDYTNCGDDLGKSHLVGAYIDPEDIA